MRTSLRCIFRRALLIVAGCTFAASFNVALGGGPAAEPNSTPIVTAAVGSNPGKGFERLPGHVLNALADAKRQPAESSVGSEPMTLTLTLRRDDEKGFHRYLSTVYDPQSGRYRHFLSQAQITDRFGPSEQSYTSLLSYFRSHGFELVQGSDNRLTLTMQGTQRQLESALKVQIHQYKRGDASFFANDEDPALPRALAQRVEAITGLSNYAQPHSVFQPVPPPPGCGGGGPSPNVAHSLSRLGMISPNADPGGTACPVDPCAGLPPVEWAFCKAFGKDWFWNLLFPPQKSNSSSRGPLVPGSTRSSTSVAPNTSSAVVTPFANVFDGTGQTIGLLEFDTFHTSDVADFLALEGAPASQVNQLSQVPINGGATLGAGESEVLLDIDTVFDIAPGAKVVVYDAPFSGQAASYTALFNAMINGGVTIISNSWASCEDQVTAADAQSVDTVLQAAAASGISVFNGAGDSGANCLDGAANTASIPASSPSATAVGGTTPTFAAGFNYGSEAWWNGASSIPVTGQGGFGVSRFFSRPTYQSGLNTAAMRSIPDVVASADPEEGMGICQADAGGCPTGLYYGGTSRATPLIAALTAIVNHALGKNIGAFNTSVYPLANTAAFHTAASMGSDFSHVGLGSPNPDRLYLALSGQTVGSVSAGTSSVQTGAQLRYIALPQLTVPADGATASSVVVRLADANGNFVGGKTVTLSSSSANATITPASVVSSNNDGTAIFTITDLSVETPTVTATDTTDGVVIQQTLGIPFVSPPAASAGISANPATVTADGVSAATITVTLKDSLNRPSAGKSIQIVDGGAHAVVTGPTPAVTDSNGQIQFSATDQVNETVTFTAVDVTDNNLAIPGSGIVTYSNSAGSSCGAGVAPVAATGFTISPYVTGLPAAPSLFLGNVNVNCVGANNPAFTSAGNTLVSDFLTGGIYQTSLAGGAVTNANLLATVSPALGPILYGKDGSAYSTLGTQPASVVQIDPTTGAVVRVVAQNLVCPAGLAVDPLSGDLFFDDQCTGGGTDNASIFRIIDPSNSDPSRPTSVVVYATLPTTPNGGMAFAPNGTLYAVSGYLNNPNTPVVQVSGTSSATVTVTTVPGVTSDYAVAIGATNSDGSAQSLLVEPAGNLSLVLISNPTAATLLATGSPGVGVTGPDGCLYSQHYDTVYRLAGSDGNCTFAPTSPAPVIKLTPGKVSPNPATGTPQTFTALLQNVASPSGTSVVFAVTGANPQIKIVHADASGNASFTYTAAIPGTDTLLATSTAGSVALTSNKALVTWTAGKDSTFLTLNAGPQGGIAGTAVSVVASLFDISKSPYASLSGQSIVFTLGASSCTATTSNTGAATCQVTPGQAGSSKLTATFAGTSQLLAATATVGFNVATATTAPPPPPPAPTVNLSVSPTSVTLGNSAGLTWSSTNATSCAASGAWTGAEATSGTLNVTPSATGSFVYTLTCSGAAGTTPATASATLAVTPQTQTVPVVTWPTPAPIVYGEALSKKQLDATANVPGTFTYNPASGTVLSAGSHKLTVTFKPSAAGYSSVTASVTLQVQQATPTIIWLPLPLFSGAPLGRFQLDAFALDRTKFCLPLAGRFVYSPPAGTVLSAGWRKLTATFTPDNQNFKTVTVSVGVDVLKRP